MKAVATSDLQGTLDQLIAEVVNSAEPTMISDKEGHRAVLVPVPDIGSWKETLYLLSSPANVAHLQRSIAEADAGQVVERKLIDP